MIILGIETSCDETSCAIVKDGRKILSHVVASSAEMHKKTGGIIPERAAREQLRSITPVIQEALANNLPSTDYSRRKAVDCSLSAVNRIDAIAVTTGPGLLGSLLVGVETAKTLAYVWNKPIVPINHLIGHIYANWLLPSNPATKLPSYPAIALVVSGGHTDLVLMKGHGHLKWLGGTRDDAAGEAFDKTARLLGLGFPGGPAIAAEAAKFQIPRPRQAKRGGPNSKLQIKLPRPLINKGNFDFSFSGLKTAVLREANKLKAIKQFNNETIKQLSFEIQESITDVLVEKTLKAVKKYKTPTLLVAGGVAANFRLREKFQNELRVASYESRLFIPPPPLCTDNAAMIGAAAYYNYKPLIWDKVTAKPGLTISEK